MKGSRPGEAFCALFVCVASLLAATFRTSDAFGSPPRTARRCRNDLAAGVNTEGSNIPFFADEADADQTGGCGEGFYKVKGEHGDVCVFDFDEAAKAFGTAEEGIADEGYWEALDAKNRSRKKFGMDPLTPEQFVVLQTQIREMEVELAENQQQRAAEEAVEQQAREKEQSSLKGFMASVLQDTCESNYDCEQPQVCCDFGFKKMCCSSGKTNRDLRGEYAHIPVPVTIN